MEPPVTRVDIPDTIPEDWGHPPVVALMASNLTTEIYQRMTANPDHRIPFLLND